MIQKKGRSRGRIRHREITCRSVHKKEGIYEKALWDKAAEHGRGITLKMFCRRLYQTVEKGIDVCTEYFRQGNQFTDFYVHSVGF